MLDFVGNRPLLLYKHVIKIEPEVEECDQISVQKLVTGIIQLWEQPSKAQSLYFRKNLEYSQKIKKQKFQS